MVEQLLRCVAVETAEHALERCLPYDTVHVVQHELLGLLGLITGALVVHVRQQVLAEHVAGDTSPAHVALHAALVHPRGEHQGRWLTAVAL